LDLALRGLSPHFLVELDQLPAAIDSLVATAKRDFGGLENAPAHSQWHHFKFDRCDRLARWAESTKLSPFERGCAKIDLLFLCEAVDVGGLSKWRYYDPITQTDCSRSEGLAIGLLRMFEQGVFSSDPERRYSLDAKRLKEISAGDLALGLQCENNNMIDGGVEFRVTRLRTLGECLEAQPWFKVGDSHRPSGIANWILNGPLSQGILAYDLLHIVLNSLGPLWPGEVRAQNAPLGDVWHYPLNESNETGLVPIHRIAQWITYSLFPPLNEMGVPAGGPSLLSGLAGYRNAGFLVDAGVLRVKEGVDLTAPLSLSSPLVVEWRALTVALIDKVHDLLQKQLGPSGALSLPQVHGLMWRSGRELARQRRPDTGAPPITVASHRMPF